VNFGKYFKIFLLESGQVYGVGSNKHRHFSDWEKRKHFNHEQQVPYMHSKDQIDHIETYKRNTVAVTKKGRVYAVGDKLKALLKIKQEQFGFYPLPTCKEQAQEEEENKDEAAAEDKENNAKKEFTDTKVAHRVWISKCKGRANYVVYALFENTESHELELYSIGKNQAGGLLGLGENKHEAKWFEKMEFKVKEGEKEATAVKIESAEGVDIRCGRDHTLIGINGYAHVFALGCYDRGQ